MNSKITPFFPVNNNKHINLINLNKAIKKLDKEYSLYSNSARTNVKKILTNILKLRTGRDPNKGEVDRVVIAWDSAGDLPSLKLIILEILKMGAHVHAIYYRSIFNDSALVG